MTKLFPATLAVAAVLAFSPAFAADEHAAPAAVEATASADVATDAAVAAPAVTEYTLKADGTTKVVVEGDHVFVVGADGAKTPAPDGDHETMTEGVKLSVKDGMIVKAEAAPVAPAAGDAAAPVEE